MEGKERPPPTHGRYDAIELFKIQTSRTPRRGLHAGNVAKYLICFIVSLTLLSTRTIVLRVRVLTVLYTYSNTRTVLYDICIYCVCSIILLCQHIM